MKTSIDRKATTARKKESETTIGRAREIELYRSARDMEDDVVFI